MRGACMAHRAYHTHTHTKKNSAVRLTSYGFCHRIPPNCETEPARSTQARAINVSAENDTTRPTVRIKRQSGKRSVGPCRISELRDGILSTMKEQFRSPTKKRLSNRIYTAMIADHVLFQAISPPRANATRRALEKSQNQDKTD